MPTYEYICDKCSRELELIQSIKDDSKPICCEQEMHRLITGGGGVILKGDGWPGKDISRANNDDKMRQLGRKARAAKASGAVPMDERISIQDAENLP